jgi:nucleoside diphosphate kinase
MSCLDAVIKRIRESGFDIARTAEVHMTKPQAEEFYASKKDKPYFHDLIHEMTR